MLYENIISRNNVISRHNLESLHHYNLYIRFDLSRTNLCFSNSKDSELIIRKKFNKGVPTDLDIENNLKSTNFFSTLDLLRSIIIVSSTITCMNSSNLIFQFLKAIGTASCLLHIFFSDKLDSVPSPQSKLNEDVSGSGSH